MGEDDVRLQRPGRLATIRYGKAAVSTYRTYATPLTGVAPIPESSFVGRENVLLAADLEVQVLDDNFRPAYTEGDNSNVVATDTMKNFVHRASLEYAGATLEGWLYFLGRRFFETWEQMGTLRLIGRELPFVPARVPAGDGFEDSRVLFGQGRDDYAVAMLEVVRDGDGARVVDHRCGREGLRLIKVTGSAFKSFVRDAYTTLPEVTDRPLFIYLDVGWTYADVADALADDHARYVPAEQVGDLVETVFHEFVSMSIQHLMHEMGQRLLARFPQLAVVSFEGQNRLWDTAAVSDADPTVKVYTDPRPPYGSLHLTLARG
ncbi:MAG: urate oxidase [Chloroflexota bacterium]|nr:urate oxidase [Chloroflexota bacterium]